MIKLRALPKEEIGISHSGDLRLFLTTIKDERTLYVVTNGVLICASLGAGLSTEWPNCFHESTLAKVSAYVFEAQPEKVTIDTVGNLKKLFGEPKYDGKEKCCGYGCCGGSKRQSHFCPGCDHICESECDCCDGTGEVISPPEKRLLDYLGELIDANMFAAGLAALDIDDNEEVTVWVSTRQSHCIMISGDGWRMLGMGMRR